MMTSGLNFGVNSLRQAGLKILGALVFIAGPIGLISCGGGSGTTYDPFVPSKIVSFGDAISDITPGARYTVNTIDDQITTVIEEVVAGYGLSLTNTAVFTSSAIGNARIAKTASFTASPVRTLKNQVADYLASNSPGNKDLFVLSGGLTDLIEEFKSYRDGAISQSVMTANLNSAAQAYVSVVQALLNSGAKRIVVIPPYNLAYTPWGVEIADNVDATKTTLYQTVRAFNDKLLTELSVFDGRNVIYAPMESTLETIVLAPGTYGLSYISTPICSTAAQDPTGINGIGIGTGQINSSRCTTATLTLTATLSAYAFADKIYPTPTLNRYLGINIYNLAAAR
jgi:outer membrane lipase/esterase